LKRATLTSCGTLSGSWRGLAVWDVSQKPPG
jgi:hypothetical protein